MSSRKSNASDIMFFNEANDNIFKSSSVQRTYTTHHIHLKGEIKEPENYSDLLDFLYTAIEGDEINIHINSEGGNLDSATEIIAAIESCEATVNGHVNGFCASAATGVLLSCHNYIVGDGAIFMIHCLSAMNHGKLPEMMSYSDFLKKRGLAILDQWYEGFLTKDEIKKVYDGKDIWFDGEELRERLINRTEYLTKKHQEDEYSEIVTTESTKPN